MRSRMKPVLPPLLAMSASLQRREREGLRYTALSRGRRPLPPGAHGLMLPTTVTSLSAQAVDLPLPELFAIGGGAPDVAANVIVRLTLMDGTLGLGEAAPFTAVSGETQKGSLSAIEAMRSSVLGSDARALRPLSDRLQDDWRGEPAARCAMGMALLDALARHYGLPLWTWFGGAGTRVSTDMTITAGDATSAARAARAIVARGIST